MLTPNLDRSKDDKISLVRLPVTGLVSCPRIMHKMTDNCCMCCFQNALRNTDIAQLLLISRTFVLDCWPAEEFTFKNGRLLI